MDDMKNKERLSTSKDRGRMMTNVQERQSTVTAHAMKEKYRNRHD